MKNTTLTIEHALYALAILLALGLRFAGLGSAPLSSFEAEWALQSLALSRGETAMIGPQPGYVIPTSFLFHVLDNTNFLSRFVPALAGALLVSLAFFVRRPLGRGPALILAFGLALDPGLVTLSRIAGGPIPAVSFTLLALAGFFSGMPVLAGIMAGLALLSGPAFLQGVVILGMSVLAVSIFLKGKSDDFLFPYDDGVRGTFIPPYWRTSVYWLLGTILVAGSLFFVFPQGLGALASAVPAYLQGWIAPSTIPVLRLPVVLVFYTPLALIFATLGALRGWVYGRSLVLQALSLWAILALTITMLYPARQVADLAWALVPLWALAAVEISRFLKLPEWEQSRVVAFGQAFFLLCLMAFAWLNLSTISYLSLTGVDPQNAFLLIIGALIMGALTVTLVGLGWSWDISKVGLVWGVGIGLSIYMLSMLWGSSYVRQNRVQEMWLPGPGLGQPDLLYSTVENLSLWQTGRRQELDVVLMVASPSLEWAFRDWGRANPAQGLAVGQQPSVIITGLEQQSPELAVSYRGQEFIWEELPAWQGALPTNWPRWLTLRDAPRSYDQVILWARADLFPGGELPPGFLDEIGASPHEGGGGGDTKDHIQSE
jgi:hypothetical protein